MKQVDLNWARVMPRAIVRVAASGGVALALAACSPAAAPGPAPTAAPAGAASTGAGLAGPTVKIGALFPITGRWTDFARKNRVALELAADDVNANGGINGIPIELVVADDGSQPPEAANLTRRLADDDKVLAIIGPFSTSEAEVAFPVANQVKVPDIAQASSKPGLGAANRPWAFRNNVDEAHAAVPAVEKWVKANDIKRAAVVVDVKDAVSQDLGTNVLPAVAKQDGVTIVNDGNPITYQTGDIDFTAQVTKLRELGFDGILFGGIQNDVANFLIEARKQGLKQPLVGGTALFNDNLLKNGGAAVEGTFLPTTFYQTLPDPRVQQFVTKFRERAKAANLPVTEADFSDVNVYNDIYLLADLIKQHGLTNRPEDLVQDREKLMEALTATQEWAGVGGNFGFNQDGDGQRPIYVLKVESNAWQPVN